MKIDNAIISVNDNTAYQWFWPRVSAIWNALGITPILYWVTETPEGTPFPYPSNYGEIRRVRPLRNDSHLSCLLVRITGAVESSGINIISDIDLFPVSRTFFIGQLENISSDTLVHLSSELDYVAEYGKLPMAFYVAHNEVFRKFLTLGTSQETMLWNEDFIDDFIKITYNLDTYSKMNDEAYMFKKFIAYGHYQQPVHIFPRWGGRAWDLGYLERGDFTRWSSFIDMHFSPWRIAEKLRDEGIDLFKQVQQLYILIKEGLNENK